MLNILFGFIKYYNLHLAKRGHVPGCNPLLIICPGSPQSRISCFFLSCKANARVKLAKTGHGPHSSKLVVISVVRLLFVLFYVLFVCKCVLPPGDNPVAVNKYINQFTYFLTSRDKTSAWLYLPRMFLRRLLMYAVNCYHLIVTMIRK